MLLATVEVHKPRIVVQDSVFEDSVTDREEFSPQFLRQQIAIKQLHDHYRELQELTMIFLGATPRSIRFMQPGALHRARWTARVIYAQAIPPPLKFCYD